MTELHISLDDTEVKKKLNQLMGDIKDFKEPFNDAGNQLLSFYGKDVFKTQGMASGEPWRALSATTLKLRAERRGHYANTPIATNLILVWTGRLQRGFEKTVSATKLVISNAVEYFKYHQQATGRPPQRKMLHINSKVIEIVVGAINDYLVKIIKK